MSKPLLSVVIAVYNQEKEIELCLNSIFNSNWKNFEVIVVDDSSTDNSVKIVKKFPKVKLFSTGKNSGPAKARNIGAKNTKSEIIFFLDADTKVEKNSLKKIYTTFIRKLDIWAVIALPNLISLRKGRAPDYNAIRNHYTLYSANPYCNYFTTQMGAIRKKIFEKLKGFDEKFESADIEDIEFGMRIPQGKVFINKQVIIGHHFPYFISIFKKYFKRAIMLAELVKRKKKLSSAHANFRGMLSVVIALISFIFLILSFFFPLIFLFFLLFFLIFIIFNMGLFSFIIKKRGLSYFFEAVFFEYVFSLAIGLGGIIGNIFPKRE